MNAQKNVTEENNNQKNIEFVMQISPKQYRVYELLARLNGQNVQEYIHQNIISTTQGAFDSIEDRKEKERIETVFRDEASCLDMDETIVLHGFYGSTPEQLQAVVAAAKALGYNSPSEFLQWAIKSGAGADLDHLSRFEAAHDMNETLEEA